MSEHEPLTAVDAAWLHMDRPTNLMMITAMLETEERLPLAALERVVSERLLVNPRFAQRVVEGLGRPRWVRDPYFDLASHIHRVGLPAPADDAALRELVGDLMSTPLPRSRPLWQVHLVDTPRGGSALIVRLHHCIGDGVGLVRLLLSLTDHDGAAEAPGVGVKPFKARGPVEQLRRAGAGVKSLWRDLTLPPDPPSALRGALGARKCAAWSAPADLRLVSAAAKAAGGTVTDLCTAAVAGAVRRHLAAHGQADGREVRALVPVNLRQVVSGSSGNQFGMVYLGLPVASATADERFAEVRRRMERIKSSPDAIMGFGVVGAMGLANVAVERLGVELFTSKASVLLTSVPGPAAPVRLGGQVVRDLLVWAPASGQVAVTCSLLSYAGAVRLGVGADRRVVPDPGALVAGFEAELAALAPGALPGRAAHISQDQPRSTMAQ